MKPILNSLALLLITVAVSVAGDKAVIRVGHFPNITHVQGLVAHNLSRQGIYLTPLFLGCGGSDFLKFS
jgi:hypothetical protein